MASYDAPALWTDDRYPCPDCAREGRPEPQPTARFYWYRVASRKGAWRRSAYCKAHQRARDAAWREKKAAMR